jgi:hypothetical protein
MKSYKPDLSFYLTSADYQKFSEFRTLAKEWQGFGLLF